MCVQAAQGEDMRQFKSWCVPSERKVGDEVEMMVSEEWTRRKKRGQVEHDNQIWVMSVGRYTFPVYLQSLMGLVQSEAFFSLKSYLHHFSSVSTI